MESAADPSDVDVLDGAYLVLTCFEVEVEVVGHTVAVDLLHDVDIEGDNFEGLALVCLIDLRSLRRLPRIEIMLSLCGCRRRGFLRYRPRPRRRRYEAGNS